MRSGQVEGCRLTSWKASAGARPNGWIANPALSGLPTFITHGEPQMQSVGGMGSGGGEGPKGRE
jgi:hypothetical protein